MTLMSIPLLMAGSRGQHLVRTEFRCGSLAALGSRRSAKTAFARKAERIYGRNRRARRSVNGHERILRLVTANGRFESGTASFSPRQFTFSLAT